MLVTYSSESPLGRLILTLSAQGIRELDIVPGNKGETANPEAREGTPEQDELARAVFAAFHTYFQGERVDFNFSLDLPGTPFQREVWDMLTKIPHGTVVSYRDIANAIERPKAVRAVGQTVGRNPIAIIVPCHRVVGATGKMTGFGYGIPVKEYLLRLEGWSIGAVPTDGTQLLSSKASVNEIQPISGQTPDNERRPQSD